MSIEIHNHFCNAGAALVLHGKSDLVDADLAQLHDLSDQQRAAITSVVISGTGITGACFRYLASLPNLQALYVNKTQVDNDTPFECLPKTIEILNLDHTAVGDACVAKLRTLPNLYSVRLRNTNVTNRGVNLLAAMPNLHECHVDGRGVSEHATQRLLNAIILREASFRAATRFLLHCIRFEARRVLCRLADVGDARYQPSRRTSW